jgi:Ca2+-transporting ATPase
MTAAELWTTDGQAYRFTESQCGNPTVGKIISQQVPSLRVPAFNKLTTTSLPPRELSSTNITSQAPTMTLAMMVSALCNNASITHSDNQWNTVGDPTEVALLVAATKSGLSRANWMSRGFSKVHENAFDSDRKLMSTVWRSSEGVEYVLCKGAPEEVLRKCTHFSEPAAKNNSLQSILDGERIESQVIEENFVNEVSEESSAMAKEGLRVLGLAYRKINSSNETGGIPDEDNSRYDEADLTFIGLIGLIDPPKEGVKDAIARCQLAGIKVIMITGDHVQTATAIANQLGIVQPNNTCMVSYTLRKSASNNCMTTDF